MSTVPNQPDSSTDPLVTEAVEALRAFDPDLDRSRAARLLTMWARLSDLSVRQFGAVIDQFPAAKS